MKDIEITEKVAKELQSYINEMVENENKVKSTEYLDWLVSFLDIHKSFSDDTWLYDEDKISKEDYERVKLISTFFHYISDLSKEQFVPDVIEEYDEEIYNFKLRGNYYQITTIVGQGAITFINKLEYDENIDYVFVDEEVSSEIIKERELIQYIIINKDYIGKIDSAKFGVHIGHACTICALKEYNSNKFKRWYKEGKLQKKIILTAKTKKLEELEENFYSVRDLGFTEVENGTLLAVSLGIMSRKEAKPFIKGMQLWKGV